MNIPRLTRGIPDNAQVSVHNLHSAALVDGDCVEWMVTSDTPPTGFTRIPGVSVKGTAGVSPTVAGIIREPNTAGIAQGAYGWAMCFGYHPNVKTTVAALAVDVVLTSDAANAVVAGATADEPINRIGVCITTGAANRAGVMIRCM